MATVGKEGAGWFYVLEAERGEDGRRHRRKVRGFSTKSEARAALRKAQAGAGDKVPAPPPLTLATFLREQWFPHREHQVRPTVMKRQRDLARVHLAPLANRPLSSITARVLDDLYAGLLERGLARASVRQVHAVVSKALGDAERWQLVTRNVARDARPPTVQPTELEVWSVEQTRAFLTSVEDSPWRHAWWLVLGCGLRRGEVLGLRWEDVDLEKGTVAIRRARTQVGRDVVEGPPKTRQSRRTIVLPASVIEVLASVERRGPWVVCEADGSPTRPERLSKRWSDSVAAARLPHLHLHAGRHCFASLALNAGVNVKALSAVLGHHAASFTLDRYSHLLPTSAAETATAIECALG